MRGANRDRAPERGNGLPDTILEARGDDRRAPQECSIPARCPIGPTAAARFRFPRAPGARLLPGRERPARAPVPSSTPPE